MTSPINRRTVLRGMMGGSAITLALPFLDCFLNTNGTALASGAPMPVRFGTWFWGCGMTPFRWTPATEGKDYEILEELQAVAPFKDQVSVLSGFGVSLDGKTNIPHISGALGLRTGLAPDSRTSDVPSVDVLIAEAIGKESRFRSLEMAATGNPRDSYSFRGAGVVNPSEESPITLYQRIFGPEFQDPNAADFTPDPRAMVQKSVLSAVADQRESLMKKVGSADRARLEEYFTSLRQIEQQFALQLEKPPPAEACSILSSPEEGPVSTDIRDARRNHKLLAEILAMALACNQTKVFNVVFSNSASSLRQAGRATTHHQLTHEEQIDEELGYQPEATHFIEESMAAWGEFVGAMANIREGDGTLLDNSLVFAHSDTEYAKTHNVVGIPVMLAGKAGGKVKSGVHVKGNGDPITRIGLTLQQLMGVPVDKWGTKSMITSKVVSEIIA
jgi:hypothetical protein